MDGTRVNRLKWCQVTRRVDSEAVRTVVELSVEGRKVRPKKWLNVIECDYWCVSDQFKWRFGIKMIDAKQPGKRRGRRKLKVFLR